MQPQYSIGPARPASGSVGIPQKSSKRLAVLRQFAAEALADDTLTMTPLGEISEDERELVLDSYLFAGECNAFEQLSRTMTMANGWNKVLGGERVALINGLRARQHRNWSTGTYNRWLKISYAEMATLAGVCDRTIKRWLAPGPDLEDVLSDYMKHLTEINPKTGRRKKPAKAALRNALLKLFIRDKETTGYTDDQGRWRQWKNKWRVQPIDPLMGDHEELLLTALGWQTPEMGEGEGEGEMPLSAQEMTKEQLCPSGQIDDTPLVQNRLSARRTTDDSPLLGHNDTRAPEFQGTPAVTQCPSRGRSVEEDRNCFTGCTPSPVKKSSQKPERLTRTHVGTRTRRRAHTRIRAQVRAYARARTRGITQPSQDLLKPGGVESITKSREVITAHTQARPRTRTHAHTREEQAAWYAAHDAEIKAYRREVCRYLGDFHLGDRTPASTATRCARLFAGAQTPLEQVADILYEAYQEARTRRGSHLVPHETTERGTVFHRTPRFLRILQALLGEDSNPAYLPLGRRVPQVGQ